MDEWGPLYYCLSEAEADPSGSESELPESWIAVQPVDPPSPCSSAVGAGRAHASCLAAPPPGGVASLPAAPGVSGPGAEADPTVVSLTTSVAGLSIAEGSGGAEVWPAYSVGTASQVGPASGQRPLSDLLQDAYDALVEPDDSVSQAAGVQVSGLGVAPASVVTHPPAGPPIPYVGSGPGRGPVSFSAAGSLPAARQDPVGSSGRPYASRPGPYSGASSKAGGRVVGPPGPPPPTVLAKAGGACGWFSGPAGTPVPHPRACAGPLPPPAAPAAAAEQAPPPPPCGLEEVEEEDDALWLGRGRVGQATGLGNVHSRVRKANRADRFGHASAMPPEGVGQRHWWAYLRNVCRFPGGARHFASDEHRNAVLAAHASVVPAMPALDYGTLQGYLAFAVWQAAMAGHHLPATVQGFEAMLEAERQLPPAPPVAVGAVAGSVDAERHASLTGEHRRELVALHRQQTGQVPAAGGGPPPQAPGGGVYGPPPGDAGGPAAAFDPHSPWARYQPRFGGTAPSQGSREGPAYGPGPSAGGCGRRRDRPRRAASRVPQHYSTVGGAAAPASAPIAVLYGSELCRAMGNYPAACGRWPAFKVAAGSTRVLGGPRLAHGRVTDLLPAGAAQFALASLVESLPSGGPLDVAGLDVSEVPWHEVLHLAVPGGRIVDVGRTLVLPTFAFAIHVKACLAIQGQPDGFPLGAGVLAALCTAVAAEVRALPVQAVPVPVDRERLDAAALATVWAGYAGAYGGPPATLPDARPDLVFECLAALAQWFCLRGEHAGLAHLAAALLPGTLSRRECWFYGAHCGGGEHRWGRVVPA